MSVFSKLGSGVAIFAASALVLSGCAADAEAPAPETTEETGGTSMPAETIQLTVGTALPITGNLAFLGPPEVAGVMLAEKEINEANMGLEIEVIYGDSGDPDNRAYETEIPRLLAADVSAIIGAASSGVTLQFIDQVVFDAEVIVFSPANTAPAFTTRDKNGLYFRAAPSDATQGQVIADEMLADGFETASMIVLNDAYGNGLADAVQARFEANGGEILVRPTYNAGDTNFASQIADIVGSNPDAVVVITFDEAKTILPDLLNTFEPTQLYLVDGNLANDYEFPAGALEGMKGTKPGAKEIPVDLVARADAVYQEAGNDPLTDDSYLAESYDTTMAIALAALMAQSTVPRDIANALPAVTGSNGGDTCFTFTECATLIFGGATAITFSGGTGPLALDAATGDRTTATINLFQYDANNRFDDANPLAQYSF